MMRRFVLYPMYDFGLDIMIRQLICARDGHRWIPCNTGSTAIYVCGHCGDKCHDDNVALESNSNNDSEAIHKWRTSQCQLLGHDWNKTVSGEMCADVEICKRCAVQNKTGE